MVDGHKGFAALLVDFENLYYFIKNSVTYKGYDTMELIVRLLQQLRDHLEKVCMETTISLDAYADFERIEDNAQGDLYLLGFDTHNVLGTEHKNAADMKLCIDAMEILHTRPEISTFVLIAGDRDYIPVIQHLKRKAKVVRVVGFHGSVSGDLLTTLGQQYFVDGQQFLQQLPQKPATKPPEGTTHGTTAIPAKSHTEIAITPALPVVPSLPLKSPEEYKRLALGLVFKYFKGKPEVWMSPYLHKLRNEVPELSEPERKDIISRLNQSGAITIETRTGEMHDYTVFKLNWNHSDVREVAP